MLEAFIESKTNDSNSNCFIQTNIKKMASTKDGISEHNYHTSLGAQGSVLLELLYACLKVFLVSPSEMQPSLGKLFNLVSQFSRVSDLAVRVIGIVLSALSSDFQLFHGFQILSDDAVDFDVRDRTLHFYRFLSESRYIGSPKTMALLKEVLLQESTKNQSSTWKFFVSLNFMLYLISDRESGLRLKFVLVCRKSLKRKRF